jgi:heme exporter protein B
MLKTIWLVFYTELLLLCRRSQEWLYPVGFFVIVISLFPLAFTPDPVFLQKYVPGCVWIAALLASLLSVANIFHSDLEDASMEQFALSQTPLTFLVLAKLCASWIATELPLILLTPLLGVLFHLSFATIAMLCLSLLLGTPVLTLLGSLCVALTLGLRQQGVLLGLLILPLSTPILIFGVSIVQQAQAGLSVVGATSFLAAIFVMALTIMPWTIAATLRVALDD